MSDTGGGHRSAAQAIAEALHHLYGSRLQAELTDVLVHCTPFPVNRAGRLYRPLVEYGLPLWTFLWKSSDGRRRMSWATSLLAPLARRRLMELFRRLRPVAVVSVHPLLNHVPGRVLRKCGLAAPFITVVTDLVSAHASWFWPQVDLCLVPGEVVRRKALSCGLAPEKVKVMGGLPIGLRFGLETRSKEELRAELGMRKGLLTVLIVGGGEGMGRLYEIAVSLDESRLPLQLLIVAGHNQSLRRRLERRHWKVPVQVFGFTPLMPQLMRASDVIVTKAGPSTISEALAMGLPILLSGFVPGQEEGNVSYVVRQGVGVLASTPRQVVETLRRWSEPGNEAMARMSRRARELARPHVALDVARHIADLVEG